MLSEIFFTFLITSVIGCSLATLKYVYKFKFSDVSCGCLSIKRDIEAEEKIDELKIEKNIISPRSDDNMNTTRTNDRFLKI